MTFCEIFRKLNGSKRFERKIKLYGKSFEDKNYSFLGRALPPMTKKVKIPKVFQFFRVFFENFVTFSKDFVGGKNDNFQ